jgi:hypothetical protein
MTESKKIILFLPDSTIELNEPIFTELNEFKITGYHVLEKKSGVADKQIIKLVIWNLVSDIDNPEYAFILKEYEIVNSQVVSSTKLQLFMPELRQQVSHINWLECKYHKTDDLYCFSQQTHKASEGDQDEPEKSILFKREFK